MIGIAQVFALVDDWPGVEIGLAWGAPALKVRGKMLTRLREEDDSLVIQGVPPDERAILIEAQPEIYFMTEHYRAWPIVLVRLATAPPDLIRRLLWRRWREIAPARLKAGLGDAVSPPARVNRALT